MKNNRADFFNNRTTNDKILLFIFNLFFHIKSPSLRLYYRYRDILYLMRLLRSTHSRLIKHSGIYYITIKTGAISRLFMSSTKPMNVCCIALSMSYVRVKNCICDVRLRKVKKNKQTLDLFQLRVYLLVRVGYRRKNCTQGKCYKC